MIRLVFTCDSDGGGAVSVSLICEEKNQPGDISKNWFDIRMPDCPASILPVLRHKVLE